MGEDGGFSGGSTKVGDFGIVCDVEGIVMRGGDGGRGIMSI